MAVEGVHRHSDGNGLSGALGQIALEADTTQFLRSLELEKTFSVSADTA